MKARHTVITTAALVACLVTATAASGRAQLEGKTDEGTAIKLDVDDATGVATSFQIGRQKVDCKNGGKLTLGKATYTLSDETPGSFSERFNNPDQDGPFTLKTKDRIKGEADAARRRGVIYSSWSGRFKSVTKVFEGNDKLDTCRLRVGWTAAV